jgi:hypothetical protein
VQKEKQKTKETNKNKQTKKWWNLDALHFPVKKYGSRRTYAIFFIFYVDISWKGI